MYLVYSYTNNINGKKYIGITRRKIEDRERNHISEAFNPSSEKYNTPFKQAIRKYGIENFTREIIDTAESLEEANEKEKYYIKKFNTFCYGEKSNGYNATLGGDGVSVPTMPVVQLDLLNGNFIKKYNSVSEAEQILGLSHIREVCNNQLKSAGGYYWLYYKDYLEYSAKELFDLVNLKMNRIIQLDLDGNFINIWDTATAASISITGNSSGNSNISSCCLGRKKTAYGFIWRTYYDYINKKDPDNKKMKYYKKDSKNIVVKEYKTLREMAKDNNFIEQTLGRHINKGLYKDYYWTKE